MNQKRAGSYKRQVAVWTAVILSVLAAGSYFLIRNGANDKPVTPTEKVTIAYAAIPHSALAAVAQKQGYYRQEGLEAIAHLHPYGKPALREVLKGKADFATVAETPFILEVMKGEKVSIIATIYTARGDHAIIARKDLGILLPSDLKGRKIGATLGTTSDFFLDAFLAVNGISTRDVTVTDVKQEELPDAIATGAVEAVSVFYPYLGIAKKRLGARGIAFYDTAIYFQTFNIAAKQEFVQRHPKTVKKMLRALVKAEEFLKGNPAEAQRIVSDFYGIDIETLRDPWSAADFAVTLDQSLVLSMEDESRWAIKKKLTGEKKIPNYLHYIYFEGLESVKPEAIRILR